MNIFEKCIYVFVYKNYVLLYVNKEFNFFWCCYIDSDLKCIIFIYLILVSVVRVLVFLMIDGGGYINCF